MQRLYLDGNKTQITLRDDTMLDIILEDNTEFKCVEARRLFPISNGDIYITILDDKQNEIAIIKDLSSLNKDSKNAVLRALDEYYMIPKITKIYDAYMKYGVMHVTAQTEQGECYFELYDRAHNLKVLPSGRVMLKDTNDNRYQIEHISQIDKKALDVFLL